MATELRETGINVIGSVPWGAHLCHFFETKEDLLDVLLPFFKTGVENNELCVWVVADPLNEAEARNAFRQAVAEADRYLVAGQIEIVHYTTFTSVPPRPSTSGQIEIVPHTEWYLKGGFFMAERAIASFNEKLAEALVKGFAGLRGNCIDSWLTEENRKDFLQFERTFDEKLADKRMIALCSYPLSGSTAQQIFDVVNTHQLAVIRRRGEWEVLETPELKRAKQEIQRLNEELEERVIERTRALAAANEELKREIADRKRAQEAQRAANSRLELILNTSPLPITSVDADGRITNWNKAAEHLFGWTEEEVVGRICATVPPEETKEYLGMIHRVMQGATYVGLVHYRQKKSGDLLSCSISAAPQRNDRGEPVGVTIIVEDITERKRAEEALRRSEDQLRLVIDTIPVMAWTVRPDGVVDYLNQRWIDYAGVTLEQYVADPTGSIHPEDVPRVFEKRGVHMVTGEPYEDEMRLRRADGEYRWFLVRTDPLRDESGKIVKWYGVSTDIEDRKRAELESRTLIDAIPQQIWSGPPDGTNDYLNERWRAETGLTAEEMRGDGWQTLLHPDDRDRVLKAWQYSVQTGTPYEQEERHRTADGTYRWYLNRGVPLRDDEGRIIRWYGTNTDIEDRKQAEEQLKATTEQLRALSARLQTAKEEESKRIARELHDELGGALTSWRWDLEEIRDIISEPSDSAQVAALQTKIEAMIKLTESTLDTVRRITSELRPMALELGLREAIEWQALQFENRTGVSVRLDLSAEKIDLDNGQATAVFRILQEALTNILRHAQPTEVTITAREASGQFILTIKDNGRGISEREKSSPQSLGLLGMRERVHLVGGEFEIESTDGKGTEVTVRVPLSTSQPSGSVPQTDS